MKWFAAGESLAQLGQRGILGHASDFPQEIVRETQSFQRSARLQLSVQVIGNMTQLYHLGHAFMLFACASHVKPLEALKYGSLGHGAEPALSTLDSYTLLTVIWPLGKP